ncbi:MAG: phytanoyl-CoA dioxygenase family protein [Gammaproteobacteria bacterium]|nr:phytanoyl-CoA dioxygenase family protein [Gammaproteobacteria bacterium]
MSSPAPDNARRKDTPAGPLSAAQVAAYHRDGYVVPDVRIPPATLERMRHSLDELLHNNPGVGTDYMVCPHVLAGGSQNLRGDNAWLDYSEIPEVLDCVAQLIGADFALWGSTVFGKPAGAGKEVPWHQDGEYWPIRPLATCSAWIAIDAATPANGCLRVLPGSHQAQTLFGHRIDERDDAALNQVISDERIDTNAGQDIALEPGQFSLHDIYLVHGSNANRSTHRRAGYVCRYMPTTSVFDRDVAAELEKTSPGVDFVTRPLYLMRGEDRSGKNDFTIGR